MWKARLSALLKLIESVERRIEMGDEFARLKYQYYLTVLLDMVREMQKVASPERNLMNRAVNNHDGITKTDNK